MGAAPPSCAARQPGGDERCGVEERDCCEARQVPGGAFNRLNDFLIDEHGAGEPVAAVDNPVSDRVETAEATVLLLPCETFNYSPEPGRDDLSVPLRGQRVLHFKGTRKDLLPDYWTAHLAARERRGPRSWLDAAAARRRLRRR